MNKISKVQIYDVAELFVKEHGRTATWLELRDALGGVGSLATINKYYKPWREQRDAELATERAEVVPVIQTVPVPDVIIAAISEAWSKANAELAADAKKEQDGIKAFYRNENDELNKKTSELNDIINILEEEAVGRQVLSEESETQLKIQIDALQKDIGNKITEIEIKQKENGSLCGRIIELEKQVVAEREATDKERSLTDKAKTEIANLRAELALAQKEIKQLNKSN